jgi:hypothetical protein
MERGSIYPSWRYHKTEPPVLCEGPEQDAQLGDEWSDEDIREFGAPQTDAPAEAPVEPPAEEPKKRGRKAKA